MDTLLENFINHLEEEYKFLDSYYNALQDQKKYVVAGDVAMINDNSAQLSELQLKNKSLEKNRKVFLSEFSSQFGLSLEQVTITNLIAKVDKQWAEKLEAQKQLLVAIVEKIIREVETNKFLLRYAMNFTNNIIKLSDKTLRDNVVYSKNGNKENNANQRKILDHKV